MAILTDTTTLPGTTIVYDELGGVAIDYTSALSSIAGSLMALSQTATAIEQFQKTVVVVDNPTVSGNEIILSVENSMIVPGLIVEGDGVAAGTTVESADSRITESMTTEYVYTINNPIEIQPSALRFMSPAISIATNLSKITAMAETTGIHTVDPYSLVSAASEYAFYAENTADLESILEKLSASPNELMEQIKSVIKNYPKAP